MNCDELGKEIYKNQDAIRDINTQEAAYNYDLKDKSQDEVLDTLAAQYGLSRDAMDAFLNGAMKSKQSAVEMNTAATELADEAMTTVKQAEGEKGADGPWYKSAVEWLRTKTRDIADRAVNSIPKSANKALKDGLFRLATNKQLTEVADGTGVYAGEVRGQLEQEEFNKLYSDYKKSPGGSLSEGDFNKGLQTLLHARDKNIPEYFKGIRNQIKDIEASSGKKSYLTDLSDKLDLAETVSKFSGTKDFTDRYYKDLDVVKNKIFKEGGKSSYYHNIVAIRPDQDLWDKVFYKDNVNISNPNERKSYDNGIEAELNGIRPASDLFTENAAHYWKAVGNKIRKARFADSIKSNAAIKEGNEARMSVRTFSDKLDPAFVVRDFKKEWEQPKSSDGQEYKQLSTMGSQFDGVYVHPEVYKWSNAVFEAPPTCGVPEFVLKGNSMWKSISFAFNTFYHGGSLLQKGASLQAGIGMEEGIQNRSIGESITKGLSNGFNTVFQVPSIVAEGHSTLAKGNKFPILLKAIRNGFALHQHDMLKQQSFNRQYIETIDKLPGALKAPATGLVNLADQISKFTDWSHKALFQKFHAGFKVGMLTRMVESKWFENIKKEKGGDEDAAYQAVSTILNNTFGGQNLEAIGRSKLAQTFMQATLLAPDWTESKMKRFFGTVLAEDPAARRSYRYSLIAQAGIVLTAKVIAEQIYAQMSGENRTMDDIAKSMMEGHFGSIYIGKTREKKPKDMYVHVFGSAEQDFRIPLRMWKGASGTYNGEGWDQIPREIVQEGKNKASPIVKTVFDLAQRQMEWEKGKNKPSPFDYSYLPMTVQNPIYAARGGYGDEDSGKMTALSGALSVAGMPLSSYSQKKEPKPKEKEKKKKTLTLME